MIIAGKLYAESPIYRGNARKTLFTRDRDGTQRLVSLAGEISGTAQSLMDAFIGTDRRKKNFGLFNQLWQRLYDEPMPGSLIRRVSCELAEESYPRDKFFDLRMGIRLNEDRWAAEANANYKYETLFKNSVFDFSISVNENTLEQGENQARLYYMLEELRAGRFWYGAGKSKGLGRVRLEIEWPLDIPETPPKIHPEANHLQITVTFDSANPLLVGWNWGKVDPDVPAFAAIEGQWLVDAMRGLPVPVQERLRIALAGPILTPDDWKKKFADYLPQVIAAWLQEQSSGEQESWAIPSAKFGKLTKGKYALSKSIVQNMQPLLDQPYPGRDALESAITEAMEGKTNMLKRVMKIAERSVSNAYELDLAAWDVLVDSLGLESSLQDTVAENLPDEDRLTKVLKTALAPAMARLYEQIDQQISLLQSDAWVDQEIASREEHLKIKQMLLQGEISPRDWDNPNRVPEGVSAAAWREFLAAHRRVRYSHMVEPRNLRKSIANDENFIAFIQSYRERTRQELAQSYNIDYRYGGKNNRQVSKKYGKPYDTVFMRMLSWSPSESEEGQWEIYIPGSTLKGAFRKRATQVLKTIWGENRKTSEMIDLLFGRQGQVGMVFFSDAYLMDPQDPERAWCSMDGVKMNPRTGQPVETAKSDFLYAYGKQLRFQMRMDIQDMSTAELSAFLILLHLLSDFERGEVPIGGEKSSGFGWVQAQVEQMVWRSGPDSPVNAKLFRGVPMQREGIWQKLVINRQVVAALLKGKGAIATGETRNPVSPPRANAGFISHRAFGGNCGVLTVEAEVLTPLNIAESGEPTFVTEVEGDPVNGWDFFSMAPPAKEYRPAEKVYALPSKSLRGMLRHIYAIVSDSKAESSAISSLNPVDSLFGWVGKGQNQAIMSRIAIGFGLFDAPQLAWFKVPYPYGQWKFQNGRWEKVAGSGAQRHLVADTWRIFPNLPLAPIAQQMDDFTPDIAQARYFRAVMPGSKAVFSIRFWNLTDEEMQRLLWTITLDEGMAHKMGGNRYLGFGSLRLRVLPESYLIDWAARYGGKPEAEWQKPLRAADWHNPKAIVHYRALKQLLSVQF